MNGANEWDLSKLDIVYAEDEFVFRAVTVPAIHKAGVLEQNLHIAEDGQQALDWVEQLQGDPSRPLLVILDVRMPVMDGIDCARRIQEMRESKLLQRVPFVVCCSAELRQVTFADETEVFQLKLPKPFAKKEAKMCLEKMQEWWSMNCYEESAMSPATSLTDSDISTYHTEDPCEGNPEGPTFAVPSIEYTDMIIADDEPVCRMAMEVLLVRAGASKDRIREADEAPEMVDTISKLQSDSASMVVFLGNPAWLSEMPANYHKSKVFVVSTAAPTAEMPEKKVDAVLPPIFQEADVTNVLEQYYSWYHATVRGR